MKTLMEKLRELTEEQKDKLATVKNEADFDAMMKEFGIEVTHEEKNQLNKNVKHCGTCELTDEETAAVSGGSEDVNAWFNECPGGIYEFNFVRRRCEELVYSNGPYKCKYFQYSTFTPHYRCNYFKCDAYFEPIMY